jgi:hypothetical protein
MFVYFALAIWEIGLGLYVYKLLDPRKGKEMPWFFSWRQIVEFEDKLFDSQTNLHVIRMANKISLAFCVLSAFVVLFDGLLHVYLNFIDFKEITAIATVFAIWPLRWGYIFLKRA